MLNEFVFQLLLMVIAGTVVTMIFLLIYTRMIGGAFNKTNYKAATDGGNVRFGDVLGVDEAKLEAREVVEFLKNPDAFRKIGAHVPKGVLLVGPPGTGKTMLAKAIANEAGVPFFSLSGSDFVEVFVGVGASRIRKLYAEARKHKSAIVFIDEIDALGRARTTNMFGGQESNNTLNAFLVELDGFGRDCNVITIGATNLDETLDPALLRPGRFDRKLHVGLPSLDGREAILRHYMRKVKSEPGVDARALARATAGMSGAELAAVINEASIIAVRDGRARVRQHDFSKAIERLGIGQEQSKTMTTHERRVVAYHEAGHAVVNHFTNALKRLHKVSIVPTGQGALGYTWSVLAEDRHLMSREEYIAEIAVAYGGRLVEELIFGASAVTSGANGDLKRASALAEHMVWDLGFAPEFPGAYRDRLLSELTKRDLDEAVELMLDEGRALARSVLAARGHELELLAEALLEREVLYEEEILSLWQEEPSPSGIEGEHAA